MRVNCYIRYYGLIKDITQVDGEELMFSETEPSLRNLKNVLETAYPDLRGATYTFAVNGEIVFDHNFELKERDEIVALPPFAGG